MEFDLAEQTAQMNFAYVDVGHFMSFHRCKRVKCPLHLCSQGQLRDASVRGMI